MTSSRELAPARKDLALQIKVTSLCESSILFNNSTLALALREIVD